MLVKPEYLNHFFQKKVSRYLLLYYKTCKRKFCGGKAMITFNFPFPKLTIVFFPIIFCHKMVWVKAPCVLYLHAALSPYNWQYWYGIPGGMELAVYQATKLPPPPLSSAANYRQKLTSKIIFTIFCLGKGAEHMHDDYGRIVVISILGWNGSSWLMASLLCSSDFHY